LPLDEELRLQHQAIANHMHRIPPPAAASPLDVVADDWREQKRTHRGYRPPPFSLDRYGAGCRIACDKVAVLVDGLPSSLNGDGNGNGRPTNASRSTRAGAPC
jgi:hypothetical protein